VQSSRELVNLSEPSGRMVFLNQAGCRMLGIDAAELGQRNILEVIPDPLKPLVLEELLPTLFAKGSWAGELQYLNLATGQTTEVYATTFPILDPATGEVAYFANVSLDISDRKQAERERAQIEEQLRQSQKMEAIGQLAGGVAHDFNNLLTAIQGYADLILLDLRATDPIRGEVEEIRRASERAASLTQQLLAFSRKQLIAPVALDLNQVIADSARMLGRLIGEDIELTFTPADGLRWILADPHQLDQILVNLAVNARDAMPDGGSLLIATHNVELTEVPPGIEPGAYVSVVVSDTGCGMDTATQARIFEPFFTTKARGKGTGLGLATVYGIVKQSQGAIEVCSQPGCGTTFSIYFPAADRPARAVPRGTPRGRGGTETILLVEDEAVVRQMVCQILTQRGYSVISVEDAERAIELCANRTGAIDLLLTDLVLPRINGRELYDRLQRVLPALKILYMSGYTEDQVSHRRISEGSAFLSKPFGVEQLASKVREVLDS
jgi:PAS domain S-box-containing protein